MLIPLTAPSSNSKLNKDIVSAPKKFPMLSSLSCFTSQLIRLVPLITETSWSQFCSECFPLPLYSHSLSLNANDIATILSAARSVSCPSDPNLFNWLYYLSLPGESIGTLKCPTLNSCPALNMSNIKFIIIFCKPVLLSFLSTLLPMPLPILESITRHQ